MARSTGEGAAVQGAGTEIDPAEAIADERARWAVRVHDRLTQSVTGALLEVQTLRRRIEADPEAAIASLDEVETAIRADLSDIRELLFELQGERTPGATPLGEAIQEHLRRWNLMAEVRIDGDPDTVPSRIREGAEAIIAEAIANAAKHSGSGDITIEVTVAETEAGGGMRLRVRDHGRGELTPAGDGDPHFGLQLMRERAEELGGSARIEAAPDGGVLVDAVLPGGGRTDTQASTRATTSERGADR